jgi:hypothetical protein
MDCVSESRTRFVADCSMDKCKACCGSFCGCLAACCSCFASVLRTKPCLYALMFFCFSWAVFDLVLSSMSVKEVYDLNVTKTILNIPQDCSAKDACAGACLIPAATFDIPKPLDFTISNKNGTVYLKFFCTWPIGPNSNRFCCACCCIVMFIAIGVWVCRTEFPKYTNFIHVPMFAAATCWWWAVMVLDATLVIRSNTSCKNLQTTLLFNPYAPDPLLLDGSVRLFH